MMLHIKFHAWMTDKYSNIANQKEGYQHTIRKLQTGGPENYSVQVSLGILWEVKIDHNIHCLNINSSGEQICWAKTKQFRLSSYCSEHDHITHQSLQPYGMQYSMVSYFKI